MLLPLHEDSLLFRSCLYYGALVLLLKIFIPLLVQRPGRVEIPRLPFRLLAVPLSTQEFQQQRRALRQKIAALYRALAETPRLSPQTKRQLFSAKTKEKCIASPLASPTSLKKAPRSKVLRQTSETKRKRRVRRVRNDDENGSSRHTESQLLITARHPLITSRLRSSHGNISSYEVNEDLKDEKLRAASKDGAVGNTPACRREQSPTCAVRRPLRLVEDVEKGALNEAGTSYNALLEARRKRTGVNVLPDRLSLATARENLPVRGKVPVKSAMNQTKLFELPVSRIQKPKRQTTVQQELHDDENRTQDAIQREPPSDFQIFCASFAKGGFAVALQNTSKRKHSQAFGPDAEVSNTGADTRHDSTQEQDQNCEQSKDSAVAATCLSSNKRSYLEAFGSKNQKKSNETAAEQNLENDQAFGTSTEQERPQKYICRTPQIVRRISFDDEVNALAASTSEELLSASLIGKRGHKQAFGMVDDEEDDTE